ncbi:hypothetical protein A2966_00295 [Candidatus Roizmanbacteria bacterium RIFCSPLOWO2_01_FULL_41_22]|uniref:Glycosyltransferase RgtA/B/C/D-like domain-containing protein n=2 Tax=Candidatus Roizmaniibacteriota TaxID=1752723 RepID=A0A1F7J888_9BACT|nr:MAG: hypothetical protein A2966_00295 [Candidatus Roizmanbacteria bacterium RIFCSPLOWO2_01_FULL_41_22]
MIKSRKKCQFFATMLVMNRRILSYFTVIFATLLSTFIVWLPFILKSPQWFGLDFFRQNFLTIYKHYDGPLYIVVAKTFYNPALIENLSLEFIQPTIYFAAHLPLYPVFIRLFSVIGYLKSMILVNVLFSLFLILFFYYFLTKFNITKKPLLLTAVFMFLPRFLVLRTVGAPESLFLFFIILSIYFFEKKHYLIAGLVGALATMTKTPGILLFVAYCLVFLERYIKTRKIELQWLFITLIPLGLASVFFLYLEQYKDFFAYFHSGDNLHLTSLYSMFNFRARWVGTAWLEDILFYLFIYGLALINLKESQFRSMFYFCLVFFTATIFVQHRDIARYSLPLWPFACIAFERFLTSKKTLLAMLILLPAIYLYTWNFLLYNVMPIANWKPYL